MKLKVFGFIICMVSSGIAYGQDNLKDFMLFTHENLEYAALKSFFYIIRQEYVVINHNQTVETRVGNDYYGKFYTIGVLGENTNLWFPAYIRYPWDMDFTFDKKNSAYYKTECSITKFKNNTDTEYFSTKPQWQDKDVFLLSLKIGEKGGIALDESRSKEGTLIVYSSSTSSPDAFGDLAYTIINLDEIKWDSEGIAEIDPLEFGNERIVGGALFTRYITPGIVRWKLSGMYIIIDDEWALKSISDSN